jgi:hypothetical protein
MGQPAFSLVKLTFSIVFLAIFSSIATAQFRAGIQGTITDANGAVVPSAKVTLTSTETGRTQETTASEDGFYRFSSLAPGNYSITVESASFKKRVVENVQVAAERLEGVNVTLETGGIAETVTVEAENTGIQTEDASIQRSISTEEILSLPQTGRDPYELVRLTPGIFGSGARSGSGDVVNLPNTSGPGGSNASIFQTENQVPISANGQRVTSNSYQVDGVSVNSQTWGGAAIVTPSQEAVKELQVSATTYSAEDGRNSGAQVKVITQNGTNDWHGSLFFKYNDPELNAFNKFPRFIGTRPTNGPQRVERKFSTYGGSIGGPLPYFRFGDGGGPHFSSGRDRSFFFFAFEGLRERTNNTYVSWVETADFRQRLSTLRAGTVSAQILASGGAEPRIVGSEPITLNAAGDRFVCGNEGLFVPAQAVNGGIDFGSISGAPGQYANDTAFDGFPDLQCGRFDNTRRAEAKQFFGRLDFNLSDNDRLAFTGTFVPRTDTNVDASAQSRPMADFTSDRFNFATAAIYNHNFSANITNEFRISYSGWGFDETKSNPTANFGIPRVEIEGIWSNRLRFGAPQPGRFQDRQYDFRDTLTWVIGNHVLKVGGAFRRDVNKGGSVSIARPLFSFVRPWNFANDTPVFESIAADQFGNPTPNTTVYHTDNLAFFVQNDWKVRPNLTLNLGLRWEYFSPITIEDGQIGNLVLGPAGGLAGARIEVNEKLTDSDFNNFGPQVGIAWSPGMFNNKLVVRSGFGIAYDRLANALLDNARRNPPASQLFGICCGFSSSDPAAQQIVYALSEDGTIFGYPRHPNIGGGFNPATGLPLSGSIEIYGSNRKLPNSEVYRYSLDAQYELPWRTVATLGYSGSLGRRFVRIDRVHITVPDGGNPNIFAGYFARPDVNTNYNALISSLRTRFYKGLNLSVNYTFGKSLDTSSFEAPCACTDQSFPVDQKEERGRSDYDVRHNFNASAVWDIPFYRTQKDWVGKLLGGWQASTIVSYNTGFPWTPKLFGCLNVPSAAGFCDPRPIAYNGQPPLDNTDDNFLSPGGLFPGGGPAFFSTAFNGSDPFGNRPGIGRNRLFGPKYFSTDISFVKRFGLPSVGFLGEAAGIDLRVNFFNVFNQLNLTPFNSNSDPTRVTLPTFGTAVSGLAGRVGELQVRFSF